ncbi:MAG: MarR family winged helix-turn-helix transcriptional regulator [Rhodoluna sp.]
MNGLEKFLSLRSFVNAFESKGLVYGASFSEFVILRAIDADGDAGIRRVDLAKAVELSVSVVTRALQPLEKQGYVTQQESAMDARERRVVLTTAGKVLFDDIAANVEQRLEQMDSDFQSLIARLG